jgi:hypothetical protein
MSFPVFGGAYCKAGIDWAEVTVRWCGGASWYGPATDKVFDCPARSTRSSS